MRAWARARARGRGRGRGPGRGPGRGRGRGRGRSVRGERRRIEPREAIAEFACTTSCAQLENELATPDTKTQSDEKGMKVSTYFCSEKRGRILEKMQWQRKNPPPTQVLTAEFIYMNDICRATK